ncbi:MAG: hypothetical protein AAGI13_08800 [Pseudomonadota bacterium]
MTDQKTPETLADDALDQAAGGLGNFEIQDLMVDLPNAAGANPMDLKRGIDTAATGLPKGKRVHKPVAAVKGIDKSTPILADGL